MQDVHDVRTCVHHSLDEDRGGPVPQTPLHLPVDREGTVERYSKPTIVSVSFIANYARPYQVV